MHLIDGTALAAGMRAELKETITQSGISPRLEILLVGNNAASHLYVKLKKKAADEVGVAVTVHAYPATATEQELSDLITTWNRDPAVDGILVQVPLPSGFDQDRILQTIDPIKDVDGFHPKNVELLQSGSPSVIPPVHLGILRLINETPLKLSGAQAVILANSDTFSAPLQRLLTTAGISVAVMSPDDLDRDLLAMADLVIVAIGRQEFLHASMTKDDAVIIDVGTNKTAEGKVRGDVDRASFETTDAWLTPVPGGVGPLTIAELLRNIVEIAQTKKRP
ncbi:MAG: bifunctional 5,10-methylenetetrahydrofolate dehydrogenase/5,10-methenyltetrahydrofolate cyclohydrolase [bacterium]|nr:bifunctional 5,10-methylenetetrahydrofolate dehydrogenase/5,10-methenyltetrahydrofolate cyclohydrolase [bacterium]